VSPVNRGSVAIADFLDFSTALVAFKDAARRFAVAFGHP